MQGEALQRTAALWQLLFALSRWYLSKNPIIPRMSWDFPALTDVRGLGYALDCT